MNDTDWMIGYDAVKDHNMSAIYRIISDPSEDKVSIDHYNNFCPGMDMHLSSGIFNKAFHNLATMDGWTVKEAFGVFVLANRLYWKPGSRYEVSMLAHPTHVYTAQLPYKYTV